jgi:Niemann-Pick C1 protein
LQYHRWSETDILIARELLGNLGFALLGVLLISFLMLVHPFAVMLVVASVVTTDLLIVGLMWLASIPLSTVSVVNLVLAIGLALGYTLHVLHAFMAVEGASRRERVATVMLSTAPAVVLAAGSTFCGVVILAGASSVILRTFFKMLLGTVVFGGYVGLFALPALLTFIGPPPIFVHRRAAKGAMTLPASNSQLWTA